MNINNDNYEIWLFRYAERELTETERNEVEQWLEGHPEAAEELALYSEAPRLERNEEVRYAATIYQHNERPLWGAAWRWAAAAAVVLALMVPGLRNVTSPAPRLIADNSNTPEQQESLEPTEPLEIPEPMVQPRKKATLIAKASTTLPPSTSEEPEILAALEEPVPVEITEEPEIPDQPSPLYVDNLIVYDDTPEPEATIIEEYAAAEVVYTYTESGVNPIGLFISTFIKVNK